MTDKFPEFAALVTKQFEKMSQGELFVTSFTGDELWATYLNAFPEGTNPVFKKRTEHDCACCRQFVRRVGNVFDGTRTVWDEAAELAPEPYRTVAKVLRDKVRSYSIVDLFRVSLKEHQFGAVKTLSEIEGTVYTWDHFHSGAIEKRFKVEAPDAVRGEYRTQVGTFKRGLEELSPEAVDTVLDMINSLYRGEEHRSAVEHFKQAQVLYQASKNKDLYLWQNAGQGHRFRNSVIGTLVVDLSEGKDLDKAVASFEAKVAPENYKRTTALITPGMIKTAMKTIQELDLESALERRFARIDDINVNDVKWVDSHVKDLMKGKLEGLLMKEVQTKVEASEEITLDQLMTLLPKATSVDLLFTHPSNLVALTAPTAPCKNLFKWNNDFAWSYTGNVADSIKERVKKAGGKVTGQLRVSLSWFNYDDLDLHVIEPHGRSVHVGNEIYFRNPRGWTGGHLDVDMNAGYKESREPVENICWSNTPPNGNYRIVVNNYNKREDKDVGFVIEVEADGKLYNFTYNRVIRYKQDVEVCTLNIKDGKVEIISGDPSISSTAISVERWGIKTEQFVKVNAVTLSPNHWGDNKVGNKHTFFFLDGCKSDEPIRGIYNEFLNDRLLPHRKVFEVIAEKTKCALTDGQLCGVGFSSTKPDSFTVKLSNKRVYKVKVGG